MVVGRNKSKINCLFSHKNLLKLLMAMYFEVERN